MTPTASSSSIILFNPVAQGGKVAAATDAQATPDVGLSGFELLLGAIQQGQQTLSAEAANGDTGLKNPEGDDDESGNALPLSGMFLPSGAQAAGDSAKQIIASAGDEAEDKDGKSKTVDPSALGWLPPTTMQPQPSVPSQRQSQLPSQLQSQSNTALDAALSGAEVVSVDQLSAVSDAKAGIGISLVALAGKSGMANGAAPGNTDNADAVASLPNLPATAKPMVESDFDTLVKHFEESSATPISGAASGGESSTMSQMSRTYMNAANTNAVNNGVANHSAAVAVPVGSDGWSDAVADKVMWFSTNKISSAEIHLNPPDLGPLQVRVSMQHDQTSVVFSSQHAAVRDALDQALPRLRDMMGSQGMHQLDVSVGGQSAQQQQQQQFSRNDSPDRGASFAGLFADDSAEVQATNVTTINSARFLRSGVDAYA